MGSEYGEHRGGIYEFVLKILIRHGREHYYALDEGDLSLIHI